MPASFNHCKEANEHTYFVSSPDELKDKLSNQDLVLNLQTNPDLKVGICGATSTPLWLMEQVKAKLEAL